VARLTDDDDELDEDELEELEEEREDLKTALDQAIRKKPRHFAIITDGPEVVALFAQKKPFRDGPLRRERRDSGGKKVFQGICQGQGGRKLIFKITGDRPNIKKSRLRDFISAATGLMVKPSVQSDQGPPPKS
jgi:CTP:molybdopterin cytidylyltransferase MocA